MIIGKDGLIVEEFRGKRNGWDVEILGAEYAGVMSEVQKLVSIFHMEDLRDITISLEHFSVVVHLISEEYYFLTIISHESNEGLCRFKTRIGSLRLRELF
jgi:predicted regulator of Ras-like GTPase activity (Roadblock/LC7/MglB family)